MALGTVSTAGSPVRLAIRPEHVALARATPGAEGLHGRLTAIAFNGAITAMLVKLPGPAAPPPPRRW